MGVNPDRHVTNEAARDWGSLDIASRDCATGKAVRENGADPYPAHHRQREREGRLRAVSSIHTVKNPLQMRRRERA
jgi:hypothetical protein